MFSQVALLGTSIDNVTMADTLDRICDFVASGGFHQIATANTDFLVRAIDDPELREVLAQCDLVVPDGMPLLWASRLMGAHLRERVTGADLVPRLGELSARKGFRLFFLGSTPASSALAESAMRARWPEVRIAGRISPEVAPLESLDNESIIATINQARPDILLVAFGNPKQEKWIFRHRDRLQVPVCIGVGGSLDFLGGTMRRAPLWMQSSGLEWFHRFILEPRRLGKRYLVDTVQFGKLIILQLMALGLPARFGTKCRTKLHKVGPSTVLQLRGCLTGSSLVEFQELALGALRARRDVVVNLDKVSAIGADALGTLMYLQRFATKGNGQFRLVGATPRVRRAFQWSQAAPRFPIASDLVEVLCEEAEPSTAYPETRGVRVK
jgi:N-acetylglucosaminyldiphosphoundecaprenol N-acetyl-beta-D-mannosaminyltransferase